MDPNLVEEVLALARNGATVMFGRSASGRGKIKIRYGPMKLATKRYMPNDATFEEIKARLREVRNLSSD